MTNKINDKQEWQKENGKKRMTKKQNDEKRMTKKRI